MLKPSITSGSNGHDAMSTLKLQSLGIPVRMLALPHAACSSARMPTSCQLQEDNATHRITRH